MTDLPHAGTMSRLTHIIVFTPDVERLRRFYQDRIGLGVAREGHGWVALRPAGAALWLHGLGRRHKAEVGIALHVEDLDAAITALRAHGTDVTERDNDAIFGRIAYFRDPEGNLVDLHAGVSAERHGTGPLLPTVVLNVRNMAGARAFYRDVLGLSARIDSEWWTDFETGPTRLALHPWTGHPGREAHHASPITIGFTGPRDAVSFAHALEKRGLKLLGPPRNEGFGTFAEAADPDGNAIVLRGTVEPPAEEPVAAKPRRRPSPKPKPTAKKPRRPAVSARGKAAAKKKRTAARRRTASRKLKR